jgi:hypothetical protein
VGLEWELLGIKSSGSGLEIENTAVGICCADHTTPLYQQKLALTSPISSSRTVGIVCSRTKGHGVVSFRNIGRVYNRSQLYFQLDAVFIK